MIEDGVPSLEESRIRLRRGYDVTGVRLLRQGFRRRQQPSQESDKSEWAGLRELYQLRRSTLRAGHPPSREATAWRENARR
jgi:hypothetical protein